MKTMNRILTVFCLLVWAMFAAAEKPATESRSVSTAGFAPSGLADITVTTVEVYNIKANAATCRFSIQGSPINEKGVCYSTASGPTINGKKAMGPSNPVNAPAIMSGLAPGTKYYVRAYAKSGQQVIYGNELSFTTLDNQTDKPKQTIGRKVESKESNSK
jgi:hypothetical protein